MPLNQRFENLCISQKIPAKWNLDTKTILRHLETHPVPYVKSRAVDLFGRGFTFGLSPTQWALVECRLKTHPSALQHYRVCDKYFIEELVESRITCDDTFVPIAWIPFSVVTKSDKQRVVFNYTWPENGVSINSQVPDTYATVRLPYVPRVAALIKKCGKNGYIGKADLKSAFRQIILANDDKYKCAYKWRGHTLIEHFMPWGTRAASAQCQLMGEIILYIMEKKLPKHLRGFYFNYIDDFIFGGTSKENCMKVMIAFFEECKTLKFKVKNSKTVWPCIEADLLGFWYNCPNQDAALTRSRVINWIKVLRFLKFGTFIMYQDLESFIGKLEFGACVVYPMKCCIRRFRNALPKIRNPHALIKITTLMRQEADLWLKFLPILNGVKVVDLIYTPYMDTTVEGDASNLGCGAFWEPFWFNEPFLPLEVKSSSDENNIAWRETFVISCAFAAWAPQWSGKRVLFKTDNTTVHAEVAKKDSSNDQRLNWIRDICFLSAKYRFRFFISWVKRDYNQYADALSKFELNKFMKLCQVNGREFNRQQTRFVRPTY